MPGYLIVQRGPEIGKRITLKEGVTTIGRSNDNDVELNDLYVSRYHSVIKQQGDTFVLIDLGSENPVHIRDTALEPGEPLFCSIGILCKSVNIPLVSKPKSVLKLVVLKLPLTW